MRAKTSGILDLDEIFSVAPAADAYEPSRKSLDNDDAFELSDDQDVMNDQRDDLSEERSLDGDDLDDGEEVDAAREHYADASRSQLRNATVQLDGDERYAGKRVSRAELDQSDADEDDEMDVEGYDDDLAADENDMDELLAFKPTLDRASSSPEARPTKPRSPSPEDDRAMLKQLKQAASADIEKGRDVKKQLSLWDQILGDRIRMQKLLRHADTLASAAEDGDPELKQAAFAQLNRLSDALFDFREALLESNASIEPPSRKRRRTDDDVDTTIESLKSLNEAREPHLRTTIVKWSDKVAAAATGSSVRNANRFSQKALNRNVWDQITSTLSTDGERLIARTRKDDDEDTFDDTDWYQQLLKDVVDRGDYGDDDLAGLKNGGRKKSKKTTVDPKASKGRKLRYDVHDKIVQFMVSRPQPTGGATTWHDEQIRELFSGLLGSQTASTVDRAPRLTSNGTGDDGSLRIFG